MADLIERLRLDMATNPDWPPVARATIIKCNEQRYRAASLIEALTAQVAVMGEALEAIETEAERKAVRWPHLKRVILIAARKARLAAAKEPS